LNSVYLMAVPTNGSHPLAGEIGQAGLSYQIIQDLDYLEESETVPAPIAVLIDLSTVSISQTRALIDHCRELKLPVLTVVHEAIINDLDPALNPDDFILCPIHPGELQARIKQAIFRLKGPVNQNVLKVGDLVIDLEKYDVLMGSKRISLTYKEFQLLALLASNPGRVYTRDVLLSQVWGYDYLGGTRTVDVHIRRLRSKIEDPDHSFVETIWNVGYRFRGDA
jgi:DNA-binding response OmpR family regulator